MTDLLQRILPTVQKPARYTGGEYNEIQKDPAQVRVDVAFCFPDTYEIGMSNVGMRILYGVSGASPPGGTWRRLCAGMTFHCGRWRAARR